MIMAPKHETIAPYPGYGSKNKSHFESKMEYNLTLKEKTLLLIDWDDTILSSSWLAAQGLRLDSTVIPHDVQVELRTLEHQAVALLTNAINLGVTAIVTNAQDQWIELSAKKFLPAVVPLLSKVQILSARSTYECHYPGQTQAWKDMAYFDIFTNFANNIVGSNSHLLESSSSQKNNEANSEATSQLVFNVLSLGDSIYERRALLNLSENYASESCCILPKSVKLIERPTISQLTKQLEILNTNLYDLVVSEENVDMMLTVQFIDEC